MSISKIRCANCGYLVRVEMENTESNRREAADAILDLDSFKCPKCKIRLRIRLKHTAEA